MFLNGFDNVDCHLLATFEMCFLNQNIFKPISIFSFIVVLSLDWDIFSFQNKKAPTFVDA